MTHKTVLTSDFARQRACRLAMGAPDGWVQTIAEPKRTLSQNDKMWAMLTDISVSKPGGRRMIPDDWKVVFMAACGWEVQFLEGLDGRPFPRGFKSSDLTKAQMADLINFMQAWGDENGVVWSAPEQEQAA